ncbi:WecB/TagA/CpsF family glycosyltransferase [Pleurocapsales cyanobacterium LEGE 10410]|nr:WecB/TagA/CpsF family glycosyltransferase [Pleurocapsales cyanobacterium LEGE 10410]
MNERFRVLCADIDKLTISELNTELIKIIENDQKKIVANHNLHSVYLLSKEPNLREFWNKAHLIHIDGMPLIWWGKVLGYPLNLENRITYLDWINPLLDIANQYHWKIYYLGGKKGVAERAKEKILKNYKNVSLRVHDGFFNPDKNSDDNKYIINEINEFTPNILMVGMGMPRQEMWILDNFKNLNANVVLNSGACFDYIAGEQKTPPRYLGKIGLEWLHRLINDPKRLSKRYLVEPISLTPLFARDFINRYFLKS